MQQINLKPFSSLRSKFSFIKLQSVFEILLIVILKQAYESNRTFFGNRKSEKSCHTEKNSLYEYCERLDYFGTKLKEILFVLVRYVEGRPWWLIESPNNGRRMKEKG